MSSKVAWLCAVTLVVGGCRIGLPGHERNQGHETGQVAAPAPVKLGPPLTAASLDDVSGGAKTSRTPLPATAATGPGPAPGASAPRTPAAPDDATSGVSAARVFAGTRLLEDDILAELTAAPILRLRPVGSTSTVFKATLEGAVGAALKATTLRRPRGPRAEVAAYRLARLLGIGNVPPAVSRRVSLSELRSRFSDDLAKWPAIEKSLVVAPDRRVLCVAIYWVDGLQDLGLETAAGQQQLAAFLSVATPLPAADRAFAAQLSTLLAFDYLIGNWDRWSGGNLKGDASAHRLIMRDHDAAFASHLREPLQRRMLEPLVRAQRFSRSFYRSLRALTRAAFAAELARDPGLPEDGMLLDAQAINGLFDRRQTLLSHIAATLEEYGEANVLVFP